MLKTSGKSSPDQGFDAKATSRSSVSAASGESHSPRRSTALAKFVDTILNGEATPNESGQDLSFFKTWFQEHLAKTSKVKSLEVSLEAILNKSYEATADRQNAPDALRTAVAFSALDHIIPVSGRFQAVLVLIRRILSEAVYGVFPLGHVVNAFDSTPYFCERESFQSNEKELMSVNAQLKHDLDLQKKQMSRCIDRLDTVKGEYFGSIIAISVSCKFLANNFAELKEKYVSSGQHRDKLAENAQSLRIKANSLEMQNKEAVAQASESRRVLDEFKAGIDKVSAEMQYALAVSKASLEEERKKTATLYKQASFRTETFNIITIVTTMTFLSSYIYIFVVTLIAVIFHIISITIMIMSSSSSSPSTTAILIIVIIIVVVAVVVVANTHVTFCRILT